jgi:hypothetical protein
LLDTMGGRQTLALNSRAQVLSLSGADRAHSPFFAELEASPSLNQARACRPMSHRAL